MSDPLVYSRRMTTLLMISGGLNIALLSLFFYWTMRERPPTPYYELKPANLQEQQSPLAIDHSNSEVIRYFRKKPFEWLVARLHNVKLVENGYTQRDLALACLVAFHHFDINRALLGLPSAEQTRSIVFGKYRDGSPAELTIYPGLTDKQYESILAFAATERWPMTSKGLFHALRKQPSNSRELSLMDAFFMSPEFLSVEMLFGRGEVQVEKSELLNLLLQGNWNLLSTFVEQQKVSQDLSSARRQRFLLDYIQLKAKAAAYLMLKTDGAFASQKLDDNHVMMLLQVMDDKSPEAEQFAIQQLVSPRTDLVWKMAATRLYEYAGDSVPDQYQHRDALSRFVPQHVLAQNLESPVLKVSAAPPIKPPPPTEKKPIVKKALPIAPPLKVKAPPEKPKKLLVASKPVKKPDRIHVVKEGETLWKIAQRYKVDIAVLRSYNKLESDTLRTGKTLKIP